MLLLQVQSKTIIPKIKLSVCISSCNHLQSRLTVRIVMGGATAGEITVKRSRPVEKYRQIYYMTHFHKNQDVIFNICKLTGDRIGSPVHNAAHYDMREAILIKSLPLLKSHKIIISPKALLLRLYPRRCSICCTHSV